MESRVMGNCHARFGAGENLEERVCSLRLHTLTKGLPIAIVRDGRGGDGIEAARTVFQTIICRSESLDGAVGERISQTLSIGKHSCRKEEGL